MARLECYEPPPPTAPPESGGISELLLRYNELEGVGVRKNWKELADDVRDVAKTHSYARIIQEARYAKAYEVAVAAAIRQRDGEVSPEIYEEMQQGIALEKTVALATGPGQVATGPGLVTHVDYMLDKPKLISSYERWVLNKKAVFAFRNKIPRMMDPVEEAMIQDAAAGGLVTKEEAAGLWTESAEKRNRLILQRNKLCEAYNSMADECQIAITELSGDRSQFQDRQLHILTKVFSQKEVSPVRRSLYTAIAELHEKINDEQFEIFKCETMMQEINSIVVAGIAESDVINKAKKMLVDGGLSTSFMRYCKGLASQKSDMYNEYKERIMALAEITDQVVAPIIEVWHKSQRVIKPAVVLTKQAVGELSPGCPLYPIIREQLKKANVEYKNEPNSVEYLARDENPFMVMSEMDSAFAFMEQMGGYLISEANLLTANLEISEIIRSWKNCRHTTAEDLC
ncbi:unnamed protein product [Notodromas monacha]|uniref:Uncharacterized protein n=1 Tax=Notodromas monacha TaxID=399045 RepID=A0A7R9GBK9_9CRUS|nr:unnamed protein product [Notodromas monacha]CAG0916487.1 unnamed protein product [Notodromas monacha]